MSMKSVVTMGSPGVTGHSPSRQNSSSTPSSSRHPSGGPMTITCKSQEEHGQKLRYIIHRDGGGGTRTPKGFRPPHFECGALPIRLRLRTKPGRSARGRRRCHTVSRSIGAPGFEPGTSATRTQRSTGLSHAPKVGCRQQAAMHTIGGPSRASARWVHSPRGRLRLRSTGVGSQPRPREAGPKASRC